MISMVSSMVYIFGISLGNECFTQHLLRYMQQDFIRSICFP